MTLPIVLWDEIASSCLVAFFAMTGEKEPYIFPCNDGKKALFVISERRRALIVMTKLVSLHRVIFSNYSCFLFSQYRSN